MALIIRTAREEHRVEAPPDRKLTDLARQVGLSLNTRCGERGTCRGCLVYLQSGRFQVNSALEEPQPGHPVSIRACQTTCECGEGVIFVPGTSIIETSAKIDDDFAVVLDMLSPVVRRIVVQLDEPRLERPASDSLRLIEAIERSCDIAQARVPMETLRALSDVEPQGNGLMTVLLERVDDGWSILDLTPGDAETAVYGVAVDIGTTTVVVALIDLLAGHILRRTARYNGQIARADDVASRIGYCSSGEQLREMQDLVIQGTINPLIAELCRIEKITAASIRRVSISCNTVMSHLFLGLSPTGMGQVPFHPVATEFARVRADALGLGVHPAAGVHVVPAVAGYIGGDIVSDLLVCGMPHDSETAMLVDIGTNGEIVLSTRGKLLACATAAGPAFEGYGISQGCRAATGAVEQVKIEGDELTLTAIGGAEPIGICGTGIIDFIAQAFRAGWLNHFGRFDIDRLKRIGRYEEAHFLNITSHACVLLEASESITGKSLRVTEADIAQILKAKAAIFAGMKTLLDIQRLSFEDLDRFVLAGGFARHLNLTNSILLGMLPDIPLEKFDVVGNGSLAGACACLLKEDTEASFVEIARRPEVVELNLIAEFEPNYVDALSIPNMEEELFANALKGLRRE